MKFSRIRDPGLNHPGSATLLFSSIFPLVFSLSNIFSLRIVFIFASKNSFRFFAKRSETNTFFRYFASFFRFRFAFFRFKRKFGDTLLNISNRAAIKIRCIKQHFNLAKSHCISRSRDSYSILVVLYSCNRRRNVN
jgi:hypothetical protein